MSGVLGGEWLLLRMPDWAKHILMHRIAQRVKEKKTRAARDVMLNSFTKLQKLLQMTEVRFLLCVPVLVTTNICQKNERTLLQHNHYLLFL